MIAPTASRAPRAFALPLGWLALALSAAAIAGAYYAYDAIAPVADLLRRQRGFSQSQIGLLNAVFSLPNIPLSLVAGVLIDRVGAARIALWTAAFCMVGAALTAWGQTFGVMVAGRLVFGIGEETLLIALLALLALWFEGRRAALAMALLFSMARIGSYSADISTVWAAPLYAQGWRPPLVLAAGLTALGFVAAIALYRLDSHRPGRAAAAPATHAPLAWRSLTQFDSSFWSILALNVLFASAFFPFRSTFAIVYFQDAKHLTLAEAGMINSLVFGAAIFATPVFGAIADRLGHRAALLCAGAALMPANFALLALLPSGEGISTTLMGISFSVIPAVIWPATAMLVPRERLGTAFGLINVLQSLGMFAVNWAAGGLNDAYHAGPAHPEGYQPMLALFFAVSLCGFLATVVLWARERGPRGHGLEAPGGSAIPDAAEAF